jgi:hypothetical protein
MVTLRIWFTAAQKAELWERWKNGISRPWRDTTSDKPDEILVKVWKHVVTTSEGL